MTNRRLYQRRMGSFAACAVAGLLSARASAQAPMSAVAINAISEDSRSSMGARVQMNLSVSPAGDALHILVGHSTVLHGLSAMKRVFVGNPNVLQSFTAGPSELVLTAKASGVSSLVVWDELGKSCLYTVKADLDAEGLAAALVDGFPTSTIAVEGREGRIYLSGTVPTPEVADAALKLASIYSKDVVSSLRVTPVHGKQVQLKLRIVEVDRTRLEQYGVNFFAGGKVPFSISTQQYESSATMAQGATGSTFTTSDPLNLSLFSQALQVGATVKDLEQKQILQILAEPTLTTMSGQSAKFLSGGEFPFPVVQGGAAGTASTVTITFKPYGVKVEFTPTVNADGTIHLKVAPEVSTLDYTNSVNISGFTVPALSTRHAETEVEIQSGQSFAVSGLLDHRTVENLSQLPGIANIPLLGHLFRTKSYTHSVVELVVLVTATVVDPLKTVEPVIEPKSAVPTLDMQVFDQQLGKEQRLPKQP
jgi:pilus assembly protein CpaC